MADAGCAGLKERVLDSKTETLRARSFQTGVIDTANRERTLRDVIATLIDLGVWVDKADATLGVVKGSKPGLIMTVTVSPRGSGQRVGRANPQQQMSPVEDPEAYQRFFAAPVGEAPTVGSECTRQVRPCSERSRFSGP